QRLADLLEVPNIGFVQCCRSLKRCVRVLCKQTGLVRIVETTGYIAFSKYLFQTWSNGPVPIDAVSAQIHRLREGITPLRRFFYQIPDESDSLRIIRHGSSPPMFSVCDLTLVWRSSIENCMVQTPRKPG